MQTAIKQSPSGILIADAPDGRIRIANRAALGVRGGSREQLVGINIHDYASRWQTFTPDGTLYDPKQLPLSRALLDGVISRNVELIVRSEGGDERWISANAAPIRDADGNIQAGIAVFNDITERVQTEAALRDSEEKFRTLVERSPFGISLIAEDGHYKYINPQFSIIFGYTIEDVPTGADWFINAFPDEAYRRKVITNWIDDQGIPADHGRRVLSLG